LEWWAVNQARESDLVKVADRQLDVARTFMSAYRSEESSEQVISLLTKLTNVILKREKNITSSISETSRYNELFPNASLEEVKRLGEYLDNRLELSRQEDISKDMALKKLQENLSKRFAERIV